MNESKVDIYLYFISKHVNVRLGQVRVRVRLGQGLGFMVQGQGCVDFFLTGIFFFLVEKIFSKNQHSEIPMSVCPSVRCGKFFGRISHPNPINPYIIRFLSTRRRYWYHFYFELLRSKNFIKKIRKIFKFLKNFCDIFYMISFYFI